MIEAATGHSSAKKENRKLYVSHPYLGSQFYNTMNDDTTTIAGEMLGMSTERHGSTRPGSPEQRLPGAQVDCSAYLSYQSPDQQLNRTTRFGQASFYESSRYGGNRNDSSFMRGGSVSIN